MNIKYTSIKSVLYELSLVIDDDRYWNETKATQWATHGLRQINIVDNLVDKVITLDVLKHKAQLPNDFRYLTQIAYYTPSVETADLQIDAPDNWQDLPTLADATSLKWRAMKLHSSPFHLSICLNTSITTCSTCQHSFSISPTMVVTTTLEEGTIMVAYKGYPMSEEGEILMPDDETLKEALLHYLLYRYWMNKYQMKESGSDERMQFHLKQWNSLSKKAMSLNNPDISQLENLKNIHNKLIPRTNRFDQLFLTQNNRENADF